MSVPADQRRDGLEPPSILILTKNEEINIERCLKTLMFSDDIVVFDSHSDDRTCELALKFPNVRIVKRPFSTWSQHSNWALENIEFKHPWVYYSDADERVTPELADEILRVINDPRDPHEAYRLRYQNMFMGKWIRFGGVYPVWIIRLFKPEKIRYEDRGVNPHPVVDGSLGDLQEHFIHFSFNKGLGPWFRKHNSYSTGEAEEANRVLDASSPAAELSRMLKGSSAKEQRRGFKNLSFFIPFRGPARFLYMTVLKQGFRDGKVGVAYASMLAMYEHWIEAKLRSRRQRWEEKTRQAAGKALGRAWR
jgi:glycosyltransferase involved in cell wall biosynthesis